MVKKNCERLWLGLLIQKYISNYIKILLNSLQKKNLGTQYGIYNWLCVRQAKDKLLSANLIIVPNAKFISKILATILHPFLECKF